SVYLPSLCASLLLFSCFFSSDPATPEIYTLSLHDALPISAGQSAHLGGAAVQGTRDAAARPLGHRERAVQRTDRDAGHVRRPHADRKSTRLNSSHVSISYAVFCLKKKKKTKTRKKTILQQY